MDDEDRYTRITLRMPKELHAQLQAAADQRSHSMNAEIVGRLVRSFAPDDEASIYLRGYRSSLMEALRDPVTAFVVLFAWETERLEKLPEELRMPLRDRPTIEVLAGAGIDGIPKLPPPTQQAALDSLNKSGGAVDQTLERLAIRLKGQSSKGERRSPSPAAPTRRSTKKPDR